ncbi:MAG: phosphoribosylaminoimidazolesuccinocarboxamide synthase, partial [Bacteroidia bacterium]|nr:phosphoribosylaminoimidazolesuccinocarboxamide synthase [Bacteroidia bacterium]
NGFQGKEGQIIPEMTDDFVEQVSNRYIELYEQITGEPFNKGDYSEVMTRIENNVNNYLTVQI